MTRRHRRSRSFIPYAVAGALVAGSAAAIGGFAMAGPSDPGAPVPNSPTALQSEFAAAAQEFHVPQSVLMAVSYRETLWETHGGLPSTTGSYNVMGLTHVTPEDVETPSRAERLSHLNMSGDPTVTKKFDADRALKAAPATVDTDDPRLHTLDEAAKLIDQSVDAVRSDREQSVRAGAALLAAYQKEATDSTPDSPGQWYAAVARYSQSPDTKGAQLFAKRVFASIRSGESRVTADGQQVTLAADRAVKPVKPAKMQLAAVQAGTAATPAPECPSSLNCNFVPAGYGANSSDLTDYGNYNIANRPASGEDIRYIVIHDTEGGYDGSLATFQNSASYASAHYLIRASDGLVTQMVETKNEPWHAANKTVNMHSIGIEHEGYAIKAGSWYTEPQYESSAALVKYLAGRFGIPLDREHVIGHDEVPGVLDGNVKSQHWDPGPFWDWNHYMSLLGVPSGAGGAGGPVKTGQLVRFVPPFTTANQPKLTNGGAAVDPQPANFGYLYTSPSTGSTPLTDPYLGSVTWSDGANWADKLLAGGSYVVAGVSGYNWTAVWYGGQKAWFYNPGGQWTVPVGTGPQTVLTASTGATSIPVYGRAYPEDAAYTGTGVPVQSSNNASLTKYSIPSGQAYTLAGPEAKGDYYYGGSVDGTAAGSRTLVTGTTNTFYPIRYNHRIAWVRVSDVQKISSTAPDATGAQRSNLLARDSSGVLWQYQGTGSATTPFYARYKVGGGWQGYNTMTDLSGLHADGTGDMVARDSSGVLWYYRGTGNPSLPFAARLKVGGGWQAYNYMVGTGDLDGDGKPDLIARDGSGYLWFYHGTGTPSAPFATKVQVGGGWQAYNRLVGTGDLDGDGKPDLIARDGSGNLWFYHGTGSGTSPFARRVSVGSGWQTYNVIAGTQDLTGDGKADIVGRDGSGALWLYKGTGSGTSPFAPRTSIGTGWQIYDSLI